VYLNWIRAGSCEKGGVDFDGRGGKVNGTDFVVVVARLLSSSIAVSLSADKIEAITDVRN
jgi:hypothetical protein